MGVNHTITPYENIGEVIFAYYITLLSESKFR